MIKKFLLFGFVALISSCDSNHGKLEKGFELISSDGRAHFLYVAKEHHGSKNAQKKAGKTICTEINNHSDYCEVYMWSKKSDVAKKLPLINRDSIIGKFEMKNGKMYLEPLVK